MRCIICGTLFDSINEAIEAGWTPYFHEGDQTHEPACRECSETLLHIGENGEMEVKEEYRGKIRHLSGAVLEEVPGSGWGLRITINEEDGGPRH